MFIKHNALVHLEINKLSLGQHLSCQKFDVMLSVLFHHMYNAHGAAHLTITSLTMDLTSNSGFLFHAFNFLFASLKPQTMTIVFSNISQ